MAVNTCNGSSIILPGDGWQVTALLGGFVSANLYQKLGGEKWAWHHWPVDLAGATGTGLVAKRFTGDQLGINWRSTYWRSVIIPKVAGVAWGSEDQRPLVV